MVTQYILPLLLCGLVSGDDTLQPAQAIQTPSAQVSPYYPEDNTQYYGDYGYQPQTFSSPSPSSDRQGIETILGAPVVLTAFAAALLGGILSPLITSGLSRLGEYEIEWPEVRRKIISNSVRSQSRGLDSFSWIEALEQINEVLSKKIT